MGCFASDNRLFLPLIMGCLAPHNGLSCPWQWAVLPLDLAAALGVDKDVFSTGCFASDNSDNIGRRNR
jgi:hypothetical protein